MSFYCSLVCKEKTKKVIETDAQSISEDPPSPETSKRLEVFKEKMTTFLTAADEKLKTENENLNECRSLFIATVKYYQYTPKTCKLEDFEPKEFFALWTSFCVDFKDIYKKEEQIAVKEKLVLPVYPFSSFSCQQYNTICTWFPEYVT